MAVLPPQNPGEPLRTAGAVTVPNREPDDPTHFVVMHRDVGGERSRERHRIHDPDCWCAPMLVSVEDSRRSVYHERFKNLSRLN